jgi:hypothetical protein
LVWWKMIANDYRAAARSSSQVRRDFSSSTPFPRRRTRDCTDDLPIGLFRDLETTMIDDYNVCTNAKIGVQKLEFGRRRYLALSSWWPRSAVEICWPHDVEITSIYRDRWELRTASRGSAQMIGTGRVVAGRMQESKHRIGLTNNWIEARSSE